MNRRNFIKTLVAGVAATLTLTFGICHMPRVGKVVAVVKSKELLLEPVKEHVYFLWDRNNFRVESF